MANIKFSYLYRDGANYKNFGEVVFGVPDNLNVVELEALIRLRLIDATWFYADKWLIPDLHFGSWDSEIDHGFHEFECISYTEECANSPVSLAEFMAAMARN